MGNTLSDTIESIGNEIEELRFAAAAGDASAANKFGERYREGDGVAQDYAQALHWYRFAAEAGHSEAQNNLGSMLLNGLGCPVDAEAAVGWYTASAKQGLAVAQYNLGKRYLHGNGAALDERQAFYWLEQSAHKGYSWAMCELGTLYRFGNGTEINLLRAAQYHIMAAEAGDGLAVEHLTEERISLADLAIEGSREAAFALFQISQGGFGVEKDPRTAWSWLRWAYDGCDSGSTDVWLDESSLISAVRLYLAVMSSEERKAGDRILANRIKALGRPLEAKERILLEVGSEGGSLTIRGRWSPSGWRYRYVRNEAMWEEVEDLPASACHEATDYPSWRAVMKAMDRYPWHALYPLHAHPEFGPRIMVAWRRRSKTSGKNVREAEWARVCGGGPEETGIDKAKHLFREAKLAFPAIPVELAKQLKEQGPWVYSTRLIEMSPYNLQAYVHEAERTQVGDYVVLAHSGHGANSYAIQYYVIRGILRMFLHLGWGGAYSDAEADAARISVCFSLADRVIEAADRAGTLQAGEHVTIVASNYYGSYCSVPWESPQAKDFGFKGSFDLKPEEAMNKARRWLEIDRWD